jgi:hypothetical protein
MNYQEAAAIRKRSFAEIMTQKLIEGEGVISSYRGTRQQISQAKKLARKERFDILNVAKFLTGGSTLAPALLGRLLGRSSADISYFTGKKMMGTDSMEANKVLIDMLDFMKSSRAAKEKNYQTQMMYQEMNELMRNDRHQEVLNVFLDAIKKTEPKRRRVRAFSTPMSGGFGTAALLVAGVAGLLLMSNESVAAIRKRSDGDLKSLEDSSDKEIKSLNNQYDAISFIAEQKSIENEYEKDLTEITDDESNWKEIEKIDLDKEVPAEKIEETEEEPRGGGLTLMPEKPPTVGPEPTATPINESEVMRRQIESLVTSPMGVGPTQPMITPVSTAPAPTAQRVTPADISIRGETGAATTEEAKKKSSQIVNNDPKPGHKSYGIFGMNTLSKTIDQFVEQNPQLGFKNKPGSSEFDKEWKEISEKRSDEIYEAQMRWYQKNIIEPLRNELTTLLPPKISSDERVFALLADRRIQYGRVMEKSALEYASGANTPEEFIDKITVFDKSNIGKAFKTYLATNPGNERGLLNRIQMRRDMALQISFNNLGQTIQSGSIQNNDIRKALLNNVGQTTIVSDASTIVNQKTIQLAPKPILPYHPVLRS